MAGRPNDTKNSERHQ